MITHSEKHPRSNQYHFTDRPSSTTAAALPQPTPEMQKYLVYPAADPGDYLTPRASPAAPPTTLDDGGAAPVPPGLSSHVGSGGMGSTPPSGGGSSSGPPGGHSTPVVPPKSTHAYVPRAPDLSTQLLERVKTLLASITPPKSKQDLFDFEFSVRQHLEHLGDKAWLLDPPELLTEEQSAISSLVATEIIDRLPHELFSTQTWSENTHSLLAQMRSILPPHLEYYIYPPHLDFRFPERTATESMSAYISRVRLWVERYFPTIDQFIPLVQTIATFMWFSHRAIYDDLLSLNHSLQYELPHLTTIKAVFNWYERQFQLDLPPSSSQPSHLQRSPRASGRSDNSGFQGSNPHYQGSKFRYQGSYRNRSTNYDRANNHNQVSNTRSNGNFAKGNRYNHNNSAPSNNTSTSTKGERHAHRKVHQESLPG